MKEKNEALSRAVSNPTMFELVTGLRRETGNHFRLVCVLTAGLLIPVLLVLIALASQNAASNLENRRLITAFGAPDMTPESLNLAVAQNPKIESFNVLQAASTVPAILEIRPTPSLNSEQIASLADSLQSTREFNFVSVNHQLLQRNIDAFHKAKKLALVLFLMALVTAALICGVVIRREIFRANSASINLQRQLGATITTISRPYIYRAAVVTLLATVAAAGLATVFYKVINQFVDMSSYNIIGADLLPAGYLILLAVISVAAGCFAAATAFQSIFIFINQLFRSTHPSLPLIKQ